MVAKFTGEARRQLRESVLSFHLVEAGVSWHFYHVVGIFQTNWCSSFKRVP